MAETSADILEEIEHEREELGEKLHLLEGKLKRSFDVRAIIEDHPMDALIIAVGTGFFLASLRDDKPKYQREPESRELNETFSLVGSALFSLGQKQARQMATSAKAGMQS